MADFEQYIDFLTTGSKIFYYIINLVIWVVVGNLMGKKAKSIGLDFAAHFCLCFFLHLIGLGISYLLIDKRKKQLYYSQIPQQQLYGQQYNAAPWQYKEPKSEYYAAQARKPYDQTYGNAFAGGHQVYEQNPYEQYPQYGEQYFYNNNSGYGYGYGNSCPPRDNNLDYRTTGGDMTYTCPHCGAVQDIPGRCMNCNEKVTNYYPFT